MISILIFVAGALLLFAGFRMARRTREWHRRLVRTEATIVGSIEEEDDSGVTYRAVYRYAGIDNDVVGGNFSSRERPTLGKQAVLHYDPSYPTNAFLEGSRASWFAPGCAFFLGISLIVLAFLLPWAA